MKYFIAGGAGFIGSYFVSRLLDDGHQVTVFDNFTSGKEEHIRQHARNPGFRVFHDDIRSYSFLRAMMNGHDTVIHLASNPDIAKAATDPDIDFANGTVLTKNILEAMRDTGVPEIIYASGSGVYGDLGALEITEDHGPLVPISTYGASKLAGEALISAYSHMFDIEATVFRFANVVGGRQTHGVGLDFIRKLENDPKELHILGDGSQSKSYIHVFDVIDAVLLAQEKRTAAYEAYNVATDDAITVEEIAGMAENVIGLFGVRHIYSGDLRGWKGDVPVVRLNTDKIKALGWACRRTSREAMTAALEQIWTLDRFPVTQST